MGGVPGAAGQQRGEETVCTPTMESLLACSLPALHRENSGYWPSVVCNILKRLEFTSSADIVGGKSANCVRLHTIPDRHHWLLVAFPWGRCHHPYLPEEETGPESFN